MIAQALNRTVSLPAFSPAQIDLIKLIAFVAMLADHTNSAFELHNGWLMLVGRAAFPLFAIVWGLNLARHPDIRQSSLNRLWLWALMAQPGYALVMGSGFYQLNVLFTFAVAGQVIRWIQDGDNAGRIKSGALLLVYLPLSLTSYFVAGLLLLWLCAWIWIRGSQVHIAAIALVVCVIAMLNVHAGVLFTLAAPILSLGILCVVKEWVGNGRFLPRMFFLAGYASHLTLLGCLA